MKKKILSIVLLVVLSLSLQACGKGGGGSVLDLNPVEIGLEWVDQQNPCGTLEFNPNCP